MIGLPLIACLTANAGANIRVAFSVTDLEHISIRMEEGEIDLLIDSDRIIPESLVADIFELPFPTEHYKLTMGWHPRNHEHLP